MQQPIKIRRWEFPEFAIDACETPHPQIVCSIGGISAAQTLSISRGVFAASFAKWWELEPVNELVPDSLMAKARAALETIKDQIPNEVFKS